MYREYLKKWNLFANKEIIYDTIKVLCFFIGSMAQVIIHVYFASEFLCDFAGSNAGNNLS